MRCSRVGSDIKLMVHYLCIILVIFIRLYRMTSVTGLWNVKRDLNPANYSVGLLYKSRSIGGTAVRKLLFVILGVNINVMVSCCFR